MGAVVYNPTATPVRTEEGQVDGKGWKYISDVSVVEKFIESQRLVIADAPEDMATVQSAAYDEFVKLRTESKPRRSSTTRKSNPGDTEVSETTDPNAETEA
jgi:hypothetical protein